MIVCVVRSHTHAMQGEPENEGHVYTSMSLRGVGGGGGSILGRGGGGGSFCYLRCSSDTVTFHYSLG